MIYIIVLKRASDFQFPQQASHQHKMLCPKPPTTMTDLAVTLIYDVLIVSPTPTVCSHIHGHVPISEGFLSV